MCLGGDSEITGLDSQHWQLKRRLLAGGTLWHLQGLLTLSGFCTVQLEERETAVAGLEAQGAELAQQRAACDALAAQLQRRAEAIAAEAEAASLATEVPAWSKQCQSEMPPELVRKVF